MGFGKCYNKTKNREGSIVKKYIFNLIICFAATLTLVLCSCSDAKADKPAGGAEMSSMTDYSQNVAENNIILKNGSNQVYAAEEPPADKYAFSANGIVFKMSNGRDYYVVSVQNDPENDGSSVIFNIEDNDYNLNSISVEAPADYSVSNENDASMISSFCKVLSNQQEGKSVPDVLQLYFYADNYINEEITPYIISKFYAIQDGTLNQISIEDDTEEPLYYEAVKGMDLYCTEPLKYMPPISIVTKNNVEYPEIFTYTFDPDNFIMTKKREEFSPENPLYFGYGYFALANDLYRYFTCDVLPLNEEVGYFEDPVFDENSGTYYNSNFYFMVDDERFADLDSFKAYTNTVFSKNLTDEMFRNAPQKYKDFDGRLHTLTSAIGDDYFGGLMLIDGYSEEDGKLIYTTKQERFDINGNVIGYEYSGKLVLEKPENQSGASGYSASPYGYVFTEYNNVLQFYVY